MAQVNLESNCKREMGAKLANFRKKLALAIGQKKITQIDFGEMYGGLSGRVIASYELGDNEMPATFLYKLWKAGHSIDALFAEGEITQQGVEVARKLYAESSAVALKRMDESEYRRVETEVLGSEKINRQSAKTPAKTTTKPKTGHTPKSTTKKR